MSNVNKAKTKKGAASLFIVVFSILLLTIISLSFIKIALRGNKSATESDLSRSAYDSAMSGVEDAKRALVKYATSCAPGSTDPFCLSFQASYDGKDCDIVAKALDKTVSDEQKLNPGGGSHDANQAYTCVNILYNTPDYLGRLQREDDSVIIPLRAVSDGVNAINVRWFAAEDSNGRTAEFDFPGSSEYLPTDSDWEARGLPPVLVVQYFKVMEHDPAAHPEYNLADYNIDGRGSFFRTLYLTPVKIGHGEVNFTYDMRGYDQNQIPPLIETTCSNNFSSSVYACNIKINLPGVIPANSDKYYVRITKRYSAKASYQVQMLSGSAVVDFAGVQPAVDSNGRANDFFRRVEARLNLSNLLADAGVLPYGAVEVAKGDFCKKLSVYDLDLVSECNKP